jgi:ribonuclease HI
VLLNGLDMLVAMKVEDVEIFGDSQLIVQQVNDTSQCLDSELNKNREECLRLLA